MDDIWRADNPRDYQAQQRIDEIDEIFRVNGDRLSDAEKQRLEEEMSTLWDMLEGSQCNNVVVRAVACRELSILVGWMQEIADLYPASIRPSRRALRNVVGELLGTIPDVGHVVEQSIFLSQGLIPLTSWTTMAGRCW